MITKEMIRKGIEEGFIVIGRDLCGNSGLCCKIGDTSFYFYKKPEDAFLSVKEYWNKYTVEDTVEKLYQMLKDYESGEEHGLDCDELDYYEFVIKANMKECTVFNDM